MNVFKNYITIMMHESDSPELSKIIWQTLTLSKFGPKK